MNNDLISREALKESISKMLYPRVVEDYIHGYNDGLTGVIDLIDNAPTVEPYEDRARSYHNGYANGYKQGIEIGKTLNPKIKQGEWVIEHDWVHCSSCGHEQNYPSNFCSKCGADMQKGDAE